MSFCSFGELLICHSLLSKNEKRKNVIQELIESVTNINQGQKCIDILINDKFSSSLVDKICNLISLNEISILLNKLIEICPNEYELLLSLKKKENNDESQYECLFWDNSDLISSVFEYLDLKSLNNCSKVNFLWCIHSFSINSIYYVDLEMLFNLNDFNEKRIWQRFTKVKSVLYYYYDTIQHKTHEITQTFIDNYSLLKHIEKLRIVFTSCTYKMVLPFLQAVGKTSNKLKEFHLNFRDFDWMDKRDTMKDIYNELGTINLTRCNKVSLAEMVFPFAISNECNQLFLNNVVDISDKWCQNLINEGAFECVQTLKIENISFDKKNSKNNNTNNSKNNENSKNSSKNIATKLAKSFSSVNLFEITNIIDDDSYAFWSSISNNLNENNGAVKLCLSNGYDTILKKHNETLTNSMTKLKEFISNNIPNDNKCIKRIHICEGKDGDFFSQIQQLLLLKQIESNIEFFGFEIGKKDSFEKLTHWWNQINDKIEKEKIYQFSSFKSMHTSPYVEFDSLIPINDYLKARLRWNQLNRLKNKNNYYNNYESVTCECAMHFENKEFLSHFEEFLTLLTKFIELKIPIQMDIDFEDLPIPPFVSDSDIDSESDDDNKNKTTMKQHFENIYDTMFIPKMQPFIPNDVLSQYEYFGHENEYCKFSPNGPTIEFVWRDGWATLKCQTAIDSQKCV